MASTELEIAQRIADGSLPSPVPFSNMWLVNLRITGTGLAYRAGLEEIVWRDPDDYLNDTFVRRCNGLPVITNHPDETILSDDSFKDRIVGTVMLPYLRGDEVWAVCRLYSREMVAMIMRGDVSTSPGVVWADDAGGLQLEGEEDNLFIEGKPYLIDHIALVTPEHGTLGVWDKNHRPEGIEISSVEDTFTMDEEQQNVLAQLIQQAVSGALQPVNERMDSLVARVDSMQSTSNLSRNVTRNDSQEEHRDDAARDDAARMDANHDEHRDDAMRDDAARNDDSMSEDEIRAQISRLEKRLSARDDAANEQPPHRSKEPHVKEQLNDANRHETGRDDAARDDNHIPSGLAHERERVGMERYERNDANLDGHHIDVRDDEKMSEARSRCDAAFRAIGKDAPIPFRGEASIDYRRRALAVMQKHANVHKDVNLRAIGDSAALAVLETAIYGDAKKVIENQMNNTKGQLVSIVRNDDAGRRIVEYKGDMNAWLGAFKQPGRKMARLNTSPNQRG